MVVDKEEKRFEAMRIFSDSGRVNFFVILCGRFYGRSLIAIFRKENEKKTTLLILVSMENDLSLFKIGCWMVVIKEEGRFEAMRIFSDGGRVGFFVIFCGRFYGRTLIAIFRQGNEKKTTLLIFVSIFSVDGK